VILGSAAKLPKRGRARLVASGSVLERGVKRVHKQRGSGRDRGSWLGREEGKEEEGAIGGVDGSVRRRKREREEGRGLGLRERERGMGRGND
jgi:hypothetical protein